MPPKGKAKAKGQPNKAAGKLAAKAKAVAQDRPTVERDEGVHTPKRKLRNTSTDTDVRKALRDNFGNHTQGDIRHSVADDGSPLYTRLTDDIHARHAEEGYGCTMGK